MSIKKTTYVGGIAYMWINIKHVQVDFDFTSVHIIIKYRCPVTDI